MVMADVAPVVVLLAGLAIASGACKLPACFSYMQRGELRRPLGH